ncbi:hypothetical protein Tco_0808233 [Tanacetum coccineum]
MDVVWTKQFKPRSSSNDVWTKEFKRARSSFLQTCFVKSGARSRTTALITAVQASVFFVRRCVDKTVQASFFILMTLDHSSSSLGPHCLMVSVHISLGLVLHLNDVWTKQFKPHSSSNDVWTKQFKPGSSS